MTWTTASVNRFIEAALARPAPKPLAPAPPLTLYLTLTPYHLPYHLEATSSIA